jgi:hypothetical protein
MTVAATRSEARLTDFIAISLVCRRHLRRRHTISGQHAIATTQR